MKKIMSIFGVILFAFALTLTSCNDTESDNKDNVECSDDCEKACCLGCKATEGEKKCIKLEDGTMPCCAKKECADNCTKECCDKETCAENCAKDCCANTDNNFDIEYPEDYGKEDHSGHNHEAYEDDGKEDHSGHNHEAYEDDGKEDHSGHDHEAYEDDEEGGDWEPPGGNMERYMNLIEEGKTHEEAVEIMEEEF